MRGWLFKDRPCAWRKHLWWFQPRDINMCLQAPGWWACLWNHERQLVFHLGPPRPYQPHSDQFWQPTNQLSGAISQQPRGSWHTLGGSGSLPEMGWGVTVPAPQQDACETDISTRRQLFILKVYRRIKCPRFWTNFLLSKFFLYFFIQNKSTSFESI